MIHFNVITIFFFLNPILKEKRYKEIKLLFADGIIRNEVRASTVIP